jgi:hypothetical protein
MSLDAYNEHAKFKDIILQLPVTLQLQFHLANTIIRAHKAFVDLNLLSMTLQQERDLDSVLRKLNSQLNGIESKAVSSEYISPDSVVEAHFALANDTLSIAIARQEFNAMHLFKSVDTLNLKSCRDIFDATTRLFELILSAETHHALSSACPCFVMLSALMGSSLFLRILRGPFSAFFDQDYGSTLYLAIVEFLKSCSIDRGDSADRGVTLAEQMWKCDSLFKDSNGSVDTALYVRNKLASSSMGDVVLRWGERRPDPAIITQPASNTSKLR